MIPFCSGPNSTTEQDASISRKRSLGLGLYRRARTASKSINRFIRFDFVDRFRLACVVWRKACTTLSLRRTFSTARWVPGAKMADCSGGGNALDSISFKISLARARGRLHSTAVSNANNRERRALQLYRRARFTASRRPERRKAAPAREPRPRG